MSKRPLSSPSAVRHVKSFQMRDIIMPLTFFSLDGKLVSDRILEADRTLPPVADTVRQDLADVCL